MADSVRMGLRSLVVMLASVALSAAACPGTGDCECFACDVAITLNVFDENNLPPAGWIVEATLDGAAEDTSNCAPETRVTPGSCSFGTRAGLYRITVQAPGFRPRQLASRFSARTGEDCCVTCLVQSANVNAVLERE